MKKKTSKELAHLIVEDWMKLDKRQKEKVAKWLERYAIEIRESKLNYAKGFKATVMS